MKHTGWPKILSKIDFQDTRIEEKDLSEKQLQQLGLQGRLVYQLNAKTDIRWELVVFNDLHQDISFEIGQHKSNVFANFNHAKDAFDCLLQHFPESINTKENAKVGDIDPQTYGQALAYKGDKRYGIQFCDLAVSEEQVEAFEKQQNIGKAFKEAVYNLDNLEKNRMAMCVLQ